MENERIIAIYFSIKSTDMRSYACTSGSVVSERTCEHIVSIFSNDVPHLGLDILNFPPNWYWSIRWTLRVTICKIY